MDLADVKVKTNARNPLPRPNEPKADQPLDVVVKITSSLTLQTDLIGGRCKAYHNVLLTQIV